MKLKLLKTPSEAAKQARKWRGKGKTVALVPTMGALHEGHIALVKQACKLADRVVVSIFVNPLQFGPNEDFSRYPRSLKADKALLQKHKAHAVYIPSAKDMYPPGFITEIHVKGLSGILCGIYRPGHFDGVATVVAKLFLQLQPDIAVFGEKDYQQLILLRRMVADLDIPVQIVGVPTLREKDGLALSSRNRYLSRQERKIASALQATLRKVAKKMSANPSAVKKTLEWGRQELLKQGFTRIDYLECRDAETLQEINIKKPARLLVAAWLGKTRLIDNIPFTFREKV